MRHQQLFLSQPSTCLVVLLLTAAGIFLYINTLNAPFVFDDHHNITENSCIRITALTPQQISQIQQGPAPNRPLASISFALNYYFHRYQVPGYHVINILIHIITGLLVFFVAAHTLMVCGAQYPLRMAFTAALLWLSHPLHTQSVTYIVQRMNALATMFYLLALLCYIIARKNQGTNGPARKFVVFFIAAAVSGLCGLGAKEITVTLPLIIFFYEWFFFKSTDLSWMKRRIPWLTGSVIVIFGLAIIYTKGSPIDSMLATYHRHHFTLFERLLTQPGIVVFYISQIIYPHPLRLNPDHDVPLSHHFLTPPTTTLAIIAVVVLLVGAGFAARKHRLFSFAILWFLGNLVLESSIIGLELIFEHRTYLPSIFLIIALTSGVFHYLKPRILFRVLLFTIICLFGFWTIQRNRVWQNEVTFWKDTIAKSPEKDRPYNNLGVAYNNRKKYAAAIQAHQTALALRRQHDEPKQRDIADSHGKLGVIYKNIGDYEQALWHHHRAMQILKTAFGPADRQIADVFNNLAMTHSRLGDFDTALTYHQKALSIRKSQLGEDHPETAETYHNLGVVYAEKGDYEKAIQLTRHALDIEKTYFGPGSPEAANNFFNLGAIYANAGNPREAITHYQKALTLQDRLSGPGHPQTIQHHHNLGRAYGSLGDYPRALSHFQKAAAIVETVGDTKPLHINRLYADLANAYYQTGHYRQAKTYYRKLLAERSETPDIAVAAIYNNLGAVCHKMDDLTNALRYYQEALTVQLTQSEENKPGTAGTYSNLGGIYYERNDMEKALQSFHLAHRIYRDTLGENHPLTQQTGMSIKRITSRQDGGAK